MKKTSLQSREKGIELTGVRLEAYKAHVKITNKHLMHLHHSEIERLREQDKIVFSKKSEEQCKVMLHAFTIALKE